MIDTIYIEESVRDHARTREICNRYKDAKIIYCRQYTEIFNRKAQNFRIQKQNPALILARKFKNFVLPAPESYGIGSSKNYYFSHMLNCLYDCRYCFLQGMYRSAFYVLFVNYEDFQDEIIDINNKSGEDTWFFTGYDCDSLALEPVTGFMEFFSPFFKNITGARFELRTKSTQVSTLLSQTPLDNCVVAFSLSPDSIARALEHRAPTLEKRINAIKKLQHAGWQIGLRFDPVIYMDGYKEVYSDFFRKVFSQIDAPSLHSVSLGAFRLPETYFKNIRKIFPDELLFAGPLEKRSGMVSYEKQFESQLLEFCESSILDYVSDEIYFPCV
ncbi:MAG: radical SAM protein [Acidiferrobacterales bacterium]